MPLVSQTRNSWRKDHSHNFVIKEEEFLRKLRKVFRLRGKATVFRSPAAHRVEVVLNF